MSDSVRSGRGPRSDKLTPTPVDRGSISELMVLFLGLC